MKIKTLLVDDEELARALVKKFMETETDFEIIGEAGDGFEAIKMITQLKPDLVFLDIQMPKLTGLELLELLEDPPLIVFSTAYDQYAIEAFEKNAVDYLLKPFAKERLLKTLTKVKEKVATKKNSAEEVVNLVNYLTPQQEKTSDRVVVKNGSKIEIIKHEDLVYLESYGDYVWLHSQTGKFLKQKTMKDFEEQLPPYFIRVHRSFLVNSSYILKVELYEKTSYQLILKNGTKLTVSKSGYKTLKETLGW